MRSGFKKFIGVTLGLWLCCGLAAETVEFPFRASDRVAWIGSSSTKIGVWCNTMEFLLRTRHPELKLTFSRHTTGGGTFNTGIQNMSQWLTESKPTLVLLNYGGNDAKAGEAGLEKFKESMMRCVEAAKSGGARVLLMTHQSTDVRKAGAVDFEKRKLYAEQMLAYGKAQNLTVIDVHHPLEKLQRDAQKLDDAYTLNTDTIHLKPAAYIAWGYFLYDGLNPPATESAAVLGANGAVVSTARCKLSAISANADSFSFTREDEVLPILPPHPLPPLECLPVLKDRSRYLLSCKNTWPADAICEISVAGEAGKVRVTARELNEGLNLSVLPTEKPGALFEGLAKKLFGKVGAPEIVGTKLQFTVKRVP